MNHGFYRVASITPEIILGDIDHNTNEHIEQIKLSADENISLAVFPELSVTGYTIGDLFLSDTIVKQSLESLLTIASRTKELNIMSFIGLPYQHQSKLYNVMAAVYRGEILALVPKSYLPNYHEHTEARYFTEGPAQGTTLINGQSIPFGTDIILRNTYDSNLMISIEICEDLWVANSPSIRHALAGATVIVNGSASVEAVKKASYRRQLLNTQSAKLCCAYIVASAGTSESTTDGVYAGHNLISENGQLLIESELFSNEAIATEIDVAVLNHHRRTQTSYEPTYDSHILINFEHKPNPITLTRVFAKNPFIDHEDYDEHLELMFRIQAHALKRRLKHINIKTSILGLSGGLDSTLALIACVEAYKLMGLDPSNIITVTMPGFGTSDRTYQNALKLVKAFKTTLLEIDITPSVKQHFIDIDHDINNEDATFENAQARERTQILMDLANKHSGIVIGTGDLSELALGWATYNGDQMSMYGLNAGIPKTVVQAMVTWYGQKHSDLQHLLNDIVETPISPELISSKQNTQDFVGPYVLHDFFLYYLVSEGYEPAKISRVAKQVFPDEDVDRWLEVFLTRFFREQFKRSAMPDGPRVSRVSLSPRAGYRMPSDLKANDWLRSLKDKNKDS